MCLYPRLFRNPKYKANKKNGGIIPPILDQRTLHVPIGCKDCIECRKQKSNNWRVRLMEDLKIFKNAKFVTLTFTNEEYSKLAGELTYFEGYHLDNQIATLAIRRFTERWRKKYKKTIRHWFVTELGKGQTEHLHLHGLIWADDKIRNPKDQTFEKCKDILTKIWGYGKADIGTYVNERTINYICKYVHKVDEKHKYYQPIVLTSKGIGSNYFNTVNCKLNKYKTGTTKETYTTRTGHKIGLPMYYRNKIYSDNEKELLWIEKLEKAERWVMGTKINVKHSEKEYWEALKEARKFNKRHGYGGDFNHKDAEYELELRRLKQAERGVKIENNITTKNYDREIPETITGEEIIMNCRPMEEWMKRQIQRDRYTGWDDI